MKLDAYDQKIVALLVEDARLSIADVSRKVSLSRSAVADRVKRLEETAYITGYHAKIRSGDSRQVSAYFEMTFSPLGCDLLPPYIAAIPEIKLAHSVSGDVDLIMWVEAESMARLNEIRESLDQWPNVKRVITHMVLAPRASRL